MDELLRYRGRVVTSADVEAIRTLIDTHPQASRRSFRMNDNQTTE